MHTDVQSLLLDNVSLRPRSGWAESFQSPKTTPWTSLHHLTIKGVAFPPSVPSTLFTPEHLPSLFAFSDFDDAAPSFTTRGLHLAGELVYSIYTRLDPTTYDLIRSLLRTVTLGPIAGFLPITTPSPLCETLVVNTDVDRILPYWTLERILRSSEYRILKLVVRFEVEKAPGLRAVHLVALKDVLEAGSSWTSLRDLKVIVLIRIGVEDEGGYWEGVELQEAGFDLRKAAAHRNVEFREVAQEAGADPVGRATFWE